MAKSFLPPKEGSHRGFPSVYKGSLLLPRPSSSAPPFLGHGSFYPPSSSSSSVIGRSVALKIHSQAEKRRRERINTHLSTLRRMVPDANKMDKASLLGRVIDHVKDLKRKAADIGKGFAVPTEVNQVIVDCQEGDEHHTNSEDKTFYIKASVCCDDRPELFMSLIQVFHGLRLRTIGADITSIGGRVHNVFILCKKGGNGNVSLSSLKESIKEALERVTASLDMEAIDASSSKRQRLLQSHYSAISL